MGLALLTFANGCATFRKTEAGPKPDGGAVGQMIRDAQPQTQDTATKDAVPKENTSYSPEQLVVWGQKLKHSKFDYPVIITPAVEHWITYFTGKGRRYFEKYLERSRYFIPVIARVLRGHTMPEDLVYLAMIESGFNNSAKSRARAVGPWQFMRQTGQRYGLTIDYWLDERRDTRKSTLAAIAYLKELYEEFGSWELSAAGYNAGENKVRRAIAKYKTNNFWEIARHRFFRRETRDYVPKIMAAAILTKNAEQFGFVSPFHGGKGHDAANDSISLANAAAGVGSSAPQPSEELTPKELGEPSDKADDTTEDIAGLESDDKDDATVAEDDEEQDAAIVSGTPSPAITPSVYMVANPNEQIIEFELKGPADLFAISKASGLPFSTIKVLNPELLRWCTPPYMKTYRVKLPLSIKDRFLATYNDDSFDRKVVFLRYNVRHGDTIQKVARRFGIESAPIREINQMNTLANLLRAGSMINLPVPTGYKRVIASMYDDKPMASRRRRRSRRSRHLRKASASHHYRLKPNVITASDAAVRPSVPSVDRIIYKR